MACDIVYMVARGSCRVFSNLYTFYSLPSLSCVVQRSLIKVRLLYIIVYICCCFVCWPTSYFCCFRGNWGGEANPVFAEWAECHGELHHFACGWRSFSLLTAGRLGPIKETICKTFICWLWSLSITYVAMLCTPLSFLLACWLSSNQMLLLSSKWCYC